MLVPSTVCIGHNLELPRWFSGKEFTGNAGEAEDLGSIPGSGISPGEGNKKPLQYACLQNPMDRGALWATVHGVPKSWMWLKQLSMAHNLGKHTPSMIGPGCDQSGECWYHPLFSMECNQSGSRGRTQKLYKWKPSGKKRTKGEAYRRGVIESMLQGLIFERKKKKSSGKTIGSQCIKLIISWCIFELVGLFKIIHGRGTRT